MYVVITNMFTASYLSDVRKKALRKGVWYRALDRVERGILSLTVRITDRVDSEVLGVELVKIMRKLRDAMMSGFVKRMNIFGYQYARKLAGLAVGWGYSAAEGWTSDRNMVRYLTVMDLNQPTGFGV